MIGGASDIDGIGDGDGGSSFSTNAAESGGIDVGFSVIVDGDGLAVSAS